MPSTGGTSSRRPSMAASECQVQGPGEEGDRPADPALSHLLCSRGLEGIAPSHGLSSPMTSEVKLPSWPLAHVLTYVPQELAGQVGVHKHE